MSDPVADGEHEETEHIPWAMLASDMDRGPDRRRILLVATVAAALVGCLVGLIWFRSPPGVTVDLAAVQPPSTTVASPAGASAGTSLPVTPLSTTIPSSGGVAVPAPGLYSEADLMAVLPEQEMRLAAVHAEMFVSGYFTADGFDEGEAAPSAGYAWVEWARASSVVSDAPGAFVVTVLYGSLTRPDEGSPLRRRPVRAVEVALEVSPDGAVSITELPVPLDPTEATVAVVDAAAGEPPPDAVAVSASEQLSDMGLAVVSVIGATRDADGWRVVVEIDDGSGIGRAVVVRVAG